MADTLSPEKVKALIAELRKKAAAVGALDAYVVRVTQEKARDIADALETLLLSHTAAVTAWEAGREAAAQKISEYEKEARAEIDICRQRNLTSMQLGGKAIAAQHLAVLVRALQPPAPLGAPEHVNHGELHMAVRTGAPEPTRHIQLGHGGYIVDYGIWEGKRAVFIEPAPVSGPVGVKPPLNALSKSVVLPGSIIVSFANEAGAEVLMDAIKKAVSALLAEQSTIQKDSASPSGEGR